jgi:two-component system, cell cycle sensor histidine kinase and response regulator CckA
MAVHVLGFMASNPIEIASVVGLGSFTWLFGILEPAVAGYALRLYRILGARVGWWVFATFSLLALGHFLHASGATSRVIDSPVSSNIVALLIPFLLLIGMAHTESTVIGSARLKRKERELRTQKDSAAEKRIAEVVQETEGLREQVVRLAEREKNLQEREKSLENSAQQYYLLFTNSPQPMWVFDLRSLQILAANNAAQVQYGFTLNEFMGRTARDLLPAEDTEAFLADVGRPAHDGQSRRVWNQRHKDGSTFKVEVRAIDLNYADCPARLILASDSTDCRVGAPMLQQEEKLQVISGVVSAVARHFENLLGSITAEADRLLSKPGDAEVGESVKRISAAAIRAAAVTQQLLTVGAQRPVEKKALDLNRFLAQLEPGVRRIAGSSISFEKQYALERVFIMADSRLLEDIVLNLVLNAREAMPAGGTLSLKASTVRLNRSSSRRVGKEETFVCLKLRDTGCGMTPEAQARLFEPFFAPRETGESRGLGLASVYGAVRQLGGWIEVATEIAAGTEFSLYFPSCAAPATAVQPTSASGAAKTILLVEPDSRMRMMMRTALEWNGYRVVETDSSSLAMTLWPSQSKNVDLLLTDVTLPGAVSGRELAKELRRDKPSMQVLYTYDSNKSSDGFEQLKAEELVAKPFTTIELLESISRCIA